MWVKLLTTDQEGKDVFVDSNIDYNKCIGYFIIPLYVDEELDLTVESDEMCVFLGGTTIVLKVNQDLIKLIDAKL
tara:strand:- start:282 stop:506 length:225 start_codon:yes stop_codon:yes gene_type:complete